MRRILILAILAFALAACSSGDDTDVGVIGEWELVEGLVDGAAIPMVPGYRITMNLTDEGTINGTAACNGYGGTYLADGEDLITQELAWTEMGCEPDVMASEQAFLGAITQPLTYEATDDALTLLADGVDLRFVAVAPVPAADLIGTTWSLDTLIQGEAASTVRGDPATLLLTDDGRFTGSTGCRTLDGEYIINADEVLFTSFSADGECPADLREQDNIVITVLGDGFRVAIDGNRLTLTSPGNEGLSYLAAS